MAATGVLPFVRGIDLAHNDFSVSKLSIELDGLISHVRESMYALDW